MPAVDLVLTLTASLAVALLLGYVSHRLGWSPIVGYLLTGTLVGPHTPGFIADAHVAEQFAEIGVVLLMFGVGLHFRTHELLAIWRVAVPGAIVQSAVATGLGAVVARMFGWSWAAGVVFGLALAVASTVVLVRVLSDHHQLHTPAGHVAIGWLIVEDLFTVFALVLLPGLALADSASALGIAVLATALKIGALALFTVFAGQRVIPWLLDRVAATRSRELFTLTVLVLALGIAVAAARLFDVSMALGAFLAGSVVGRSEYSQRAASEALPMRDAFAVLFFVSVGMLLDPQYLVQAPGLIAATLAVVMIGKPAVALLVVRLLRHPFGLALTVAVALAQIGEFSFILTVLGRDLGILPAQAMSTVVAAAIVSIVANPLLYRLVRPIDRWISRRPRISRLLNAPSDAEVGSGDQVQHAPAEAAHRAVIIGYGPTGRILTRLLGENGIHPTVVELNRETVRMLKDVRIAAVYGDAGHVETLEAAGVGAAGSLIVSAAGLGNSAEVIRNARDLNTGIYVLARAASLREAAALRAAGADAVFSGEREVALALTEAMLQRLGAAPEQIDRERERVHRDLTPEGPAHGSTAHSP